MKVAIIVILVGALAVAAAVGVWYYKTKFYVPDKGGMERDLSDTVISCSYSKGGGMDGGSMGISIRVNDKNEVWFDYYNTPYNGAEEETASYQVSQDAIEEIRTVCKKYEVLSWGELPYSEIQLLDAPTTTISFVYGDNEYYSVNSNHECPKKGRGFFNDICNVLNQYNQQGDD